MTTATARRPGWRSPSRPGPTDPATSRYAAADWTAIGTPIRLVVTDPASLAEARELLVAELAALDQTASRFRADSELRRLERRPGRPTRVSRLLAELVDVALRAAEETDGDLDPTVGGPLGELGYDTDFTLVPPAGPAVPLRVTRLPDWRQVDLDRSAHTLRVPPGVRLDLGATAKAWAADRAAGRLAGRCGCGVLVSLGGDISVAGPPPAGGWPVRVQDRTSHPDDPASGPCQVVRMSGGGLATSSTTTRRWRRGGTELHHILDPRRGLPAASVWRTVSVAAGSALAANVAATTAVIRGATAPGWLAGRGLAARLVSVDGAVRTLGGWPGADAA